MGAKKKTDLIFKKYGGGLYDDGSAWKHMDVLTEYQILEACEPVNIRKALGRKLILVIVNVMNKSMRVYEYTTCIH